LSAESTTTAEGCGRPRGFWDEFLRVRPASPVSEGMFPFDPAIRQQYVEVYDRIYVDWERRTVDAGFDVEEFVLACTRVRAAMY